MSNNEQLVRQFLACWSKLDVDQIVGYFAEDGVYHNMPMGPVRGTQQLKGFIAAFLKNWTSTEWEVLHLLSAGDIVIAERIDRTKVGDKSIDLPCCGVFEIQDGKIKMWRDYFDLATYTKSLAT